MNRPLTSAEDTDLVRDIPPTWVAVKKYYPQQVRKALDEDADNDAIVEASVEMILLGKVERERDQLIKQARQMAEKNDADPNDIDGPTLDEVEESYWARLGSYLDVKLPKTYFDELNLGLYYFDETGTSFPINTKSTTLGAKAASYTPYWMSSMGYKLKLELTFDKDKKSGAVSLVSERYVQSKDPRYEALFCAGMVRDTRCLAALGFPIIEEHAFPAAFLNQDYTVDAITKVIRQTRCPMVRDHNPDFDVMTFFEGLYDNGELPLADKTDVRRFLMALASPLLRLVAPGLLGVYWFVGPSGAGKDFLATMLCQIWQKAVVSNSAPVSFDLTDVDDLELSRKLYKAKAALFARAKEAGKSTAKILRLIQFAGTDQVTKRGLYKHEVPAANVYTFVADSAEQLPDKREISRRTVPINVFPCSKSVSLGKVLQRVVDHSADIIAALIRLVESKPSSFFTDVAETDSRPTVPVALSRLLNVTLDEVEGRDFTDLFEAMLEYQRLSRDKGYEYLAKARKLKGNRTKAEKSLPSYSYAHFVEYMSSNWHEGNRIEPRGYRLLLKEFFSHRILRKCLDTEMGYNRVGKSMPYLPVEIHGEPFAFLFVGSDKQNFVLEKEAKFCAKVGCKPLSPALADKQPEIEEIEDAVDQAETTIKAGLDSKIDEIQKDETSDSSTNRFRIELIKSMADDALEKINSEYDEAMSALANASAVNA